MAYEFTRLSDVPMSDSVSDECSVLVEDGGEIKRTIKSNIGKEQVQADWNQTDPTQPDYIKNKLSCDLPYQSLVTDGNGKAKWEDRLAYDDSKLVIDVGEGNQLVKVSDEIPSWASVDASMKLWASAGAPKTVPAAANMDLGNGSFMVSEYAAFITTDNVEFESYGIVFPEQGVYFVYAPDNFYVAGIASADSDTPEITWDGNIGIKKLDEKFLPEPLILYVHESESGV